MKIAAVPASIQLTICRSYFKSWSAVEDGADGDNDLLDADLPRAVHYLRAVIFVFSAARVDAVKDLISQVGSDV